MAYFILGFVVGIGLGIFGTTRMHQARVQRLAVTGSSPLAPLVPRADLAATGPKTPTKKAAKLGLTEADFRPSDDILARMQRAWDLGISLEELDQREKRDEPGDGRAGVRAGGATSPSTVTEAVAALADEGYGDDLHLGDGSLACHACGTTHATDLVVVDRVFRFEGPSDPADEAIVLGLQCPACGARGSLVSAFGPDADPDLAQAFVYLASRAEHG